MSIEENKKVAARFCEQFSAGDIAGAMANVADDGTWWLAGKPELMKPTGVYTKQKMAQLFEGLMTQLKEGLKLTVKGMVAEGDKVAIELVGHGELKNGRSYSNDYHLLMVIRDGKIREVKEYHDTHYFVATWRQP